MAWQLPDTLLWGAYSIAQGTAPYRTGNLAFNAIRVYKVAWGGKIDYSLVDAHYIKFLNDLRYIKKRNGKKYKNKHYDFIGNTTLKIAGYLENRLNGKNYPIHSYNNKNTQRSNQNLENRRLVHLRSLSRYGTNY